MNMLSIFRRSSLDVPHVKIDADVMIYMEDIELLFSLDKLIAAEFRDGLLYLWLMGANTNPFIVTEEAIAIGLWEVIKNRMLDKWIRLRYNPKTSKVEQYYEVNK